MEISKELKNYELSFVKLYRHKYNVEYMKIKHNNGLVPTKVILYNRYKKVINRHPTYCGVTVKNMFSELSENHLYAVDEIIEIISKGCD